jgi:hypothetical protein
MVKLRVPEGPVEFSDPGDPAWKEYEKAIAHIEESAGNCTVIRDHKITGRSGTQRQVDVWLDATVGNNHTVSVAIECKRYSAIPVAIKDIDAFVAFLDDVAAHKGVMISHSGFTDGATRRAAGANIELKTLTLEEAAEFDWDEYVADSCAVGGCYGTIHWQFSDGASEGGYCGMCGAFHVRCGSCGETDWYDENQIEKCSGCSMRWELDSDDGMTSGIAEMPADEETDQGEHE